MIEGVEITPLKTIEDDRGSIRHMMRWDREPFIQFGEIYFSTIKPSVVKAWHLHKEMTLNYAVVSGAIMVGLVDLRPASPTFGEQWQIRLGDDASSYKLLTIPPWVWNGFRVPAGRKRSAIVANCATMAHDPEEIVRMHPRDFPVEFDWGPYRVAG